MNTLLQGGEKKTDQENDNETNIYKEGTKLDK
jgi:hypothetical protein